MLQLSITTWIVLGCSTLCVGWLIILFVRAPSGSEDEQGWRRDQTGRSNEPGASEALSTTGIQPPDDNLAPGYAGPLST